MPNSLWPHTIACQAPLSVGFSRQECWSRLPFPSPDKKGGSGVCSLQDAGTHWLMLKEGKKTDPLPGETTPLPGGCCCCSVTKMCLTLCGSMDCSMPDFPVLHYLQEFAQAHVHWDGWREHGAQHPTLIPLASPVTAEGRRAPVGLTADAEQLDLHGKETHGYPQSSTLKFQAQRMIWGWCWAGRWRCSITTCQPSKDREQEREQELPETQETQRGRYSGLGENWGQGLNTEENLSALQLLPEHRAS